MNSHGANPLLTLFDRHQLAQNRRRSTVRLGDYDFLPREIYARLVERIGEIRRPFKRVLNLGGGAGFADLLPAGALSPFAIEERIDCDLVRERLPPQGDYRLVASEEFLPFAAGQFDLIVAPLCLHWVNDLPGCLSQINHCLRPDGVFLAALWGGETLEQLRQSWLRAETEMTGGAAPRIAPMADGEAMAGLLQRAGFALPMVDRDDLTLSYDHPLRLMAELRGMGEGNCLTSRSRKPITRSLLKRVCEYYPVQANGKIEAKFACFYLTGWAVAAGQPQALKPGSGQSDLRSVLKSS
ncbi:MAG: methyltransferase domain-containing protein [Candidatus Pacebacteria bacterium]|nr:methyltransferase domain-containing protein [Candidatus Paceibacterota bacterium]